MINLHVANGVGDTQIIANDTLLKIAVDHHYYIIILAIAIIMY